MTTDNPAQDKDLLDELMGKTEGKPGNSKLAGATMELPDGPLPTSPDPVRELDVKEPEKPSPAKLADETHATSKGGDGYALTIEGQAYTMSPDKVKAEKPYKVTVKVTRLEGALSLLRKQPRSGGDSFLDATVRKVIGDSFRGVRTYNIVGAVPLNAKTSAPSNLQFMTLEQLKATAKERSAPIKLEDYGDNVVALREALMDFFLNPKGFAEREAARSAEIAERRELEGLNA